MKRHTQRTKPASLRLLDDVLDWLRYGNIYVVSAVPVLLGIVVLRQALSGLFVNGEYLYDDVGARILAAFAVFIMGLSGALQVWRREVPGPLGGSTRGVIAVVLGWTWMLIFWGAAVGSLFLGGSPAP